MSWDESFTKLLERCYEIYRSGNYDFESYYSKEDLAFLESIGYKPRELFDFVEDWVGEGAPSPSAALLIAAVRRDYFLVVQKGKRSSHEIRFTDLPTFGDTMGGIPYLPRIIKKARHKLKGELDPDIMYCCGGDRKFLRENGNIHPADFLRHVWAAGDDDEQILQYVKASR